MKTIVIASHNKDVTSLFLLKKIKEKGMPCTMLNLANFPLKTSISFVVENNVSDSFFIKTSSKKKLLPQNISGIWWRRPYGITKNKAFSTMQNYIKMESTVMINSIFDLIGEEKTVWVSNPTATQMANLKPLQLQTANQVGIRFPKTCFGNDPETMESFVKQHAQIPLVIKAIGNSFVRLSLGREKTTQKDRVIFTRITPHEKILSSIESAQYCPIIIQEAFIKDSDIRVTVVGDEIFASEITTNTNKDSDLLDWRHFATEKEYKYHKLPDDIAEKCILLTKKLGLKFGAIDLGFSKKNGYCFFEINPQGQWLPSELIVGHPISEALIGLLSKNT